MSSTNGTIRPLGMDDEAIWRPLWQAYLTFYEAELPEAVTQTTWRRLMDPAEPVRGALAFDEAGRAVGLVHWLFHRSTWAEGDYCYLNDLFVDGDQRGKGVGRALIDHVHADAAAQGAVKVYWLTHETNTTAQRLYNAVAERTGFIQYRKLIAR
ncbi:GNAT family N-acetyltransferase [Ancylobacter amanitiformis]|uniref:GNAT superfamily N-acetyltransferase n=1 Tax=Ancylobacter amanitiformis TaxID=217069 RepID=A0ABU0LTA1_9HYPH|nr:GNAT family N-acetyltransferase [Ancylobacter amanitiformis]MDQ0511932.1 GNAT superfamily N-acetyltransferase [Ancylobacter amanitiformis]